MNGSSFIVNHKVALPGGAEHKGIGSSRILYIANRQGAVLDETDDDLRIRAQNERMAKLGYIEFRPGSVAERNSGHALFDQSGIPERAKVQRELKEAQGAILTSVVSVRREDAEALRLSTKQDWERFLRANWGNHIEAMEIIGRENVRWVAAFHVNQENNLHCHVFTWSRKPGEFDSLIPKERLSSAQQSLAALALRPEQERLGLRRTEARDELVEAVMKRCRQSEALQARVRQSLPPSGSLKYGNIARRHPKARRAVDRAADLAIERDERASRLYSEYMRAVSEKADLKRLRSQERAAYILAAENDMRTRLGNAVMASCRASPTQRPAPRQQRPDLGSTYPPPPSPGQRRRRERMSEEFRACLPKRRRVEFARALSSGERPSEKSMLALPSVSSALKRSSQNAGAFCDGAASAFGGIAERAAANAAGDGRRADAGDEIGETAERRTIEALCSAIASISMPRGPSLSKKNKQIERINP